MTQYNFDSVDVFKYVTEQNAPIYRAIMRFLYDKHMSFEHNSTTFEEISKMLKENNVVDKNFSDANLQDSLSALEKWEAVTSDKMKRRGMTIEEFKKSRYSYQITDIGVGIEELLIRIDNVDESLFGRMDSKQFDVLLKNLMLMHDTIPKYTTNHERVVEIWTNVFETHKDLRAGASDYLNRIQRAEKENLFKTELFLEFKDTIIQYLGSFITKLNQTKHKIHKIIRSIDEPHIDAYIEAMIEGNKANAILYDNFSPENLRISLKNKWYELNVWFIGRNGAMSDVEVLGEKTTEAISMIASYANRLSDTTSNSQSRIDDYKALAKRFRESHSLTDAHLTYASTFGSTHSRSLFGFDEIAIQHDGSYSTGDEIWVTDTLKFTTPNMSNRGPRGKTKASSIKNNKQEHQKRLLEKLKQRKLEEESMKSLIKDGKIVLKEIDSLETFQRKTMLKWIKRTTKQRLGKKQQRRPVKTEFGQAFKIRYMSKETIEIRCEDGVLRGPDIEIVFDGGES